MSTTTARPGVRSEFWTLVGLLALGLLARLVFMPSEGFKSDVGSFEGWALQVSSHPLWQMYTGKTFLDYPPGYLYPLWVTGKLYMPFVNADHYGPLFRFLVKLPAVLMDLVNGYVIFLIVRRFADFRWAIGAAALYVLNPATIFLSGSYGQIDAVPGGLALLAVYLFMRSDDLEDRRATQFIVLGWLAYAYCLLIKPQAAILLPLLIAFAFTNRERRAMRIRALTLGIGASLVLAWLVAVPFHPVANPIAVFAWLLGTYAHGTSVYAYNSVNAFNLWTIRYTFWKSDSDLILFYPMYLWGILLLGAATVLVLLRYLQVATQRAFLEAACLLTLAFFVLSTRMHERYVFDALMFSIPLVFLGRRYITASVILSVTFLTNLFYALHYLTVMNDKLPENAMDLWPAITHPMSLANVAVFFVLGYTFLGGTEGTEALSDRQPQSREAVPVEEGVPPRSWFDPREGLAAMQWPIDYAIATILGMVSFVVSFIGYANVKEKIFDEIYFARAAEEYLKHWYIYENTHPPLTKLLITASVWMFGGLAHGDNAAGWRFLDVVFGALMVSLLYIFAKRITRSSLFAGIAAALLLFDGMHFVQSRIATPESFVGFFSLATIYTFYRYWIASQVRTAQEVDGQQLTYRIFGTVGCLLFAIVAVLVRFNAETGDPAWVPVAKFVVIVYVFAGLYLLFRSLILPRFFHSARMFTSYPEGGTLKTDGTRTVVTAPDGGVVDSAQKNVIRGDLSENERGALVLTDEDLVATYRKDGSLEYATPLSTARYAGDAVSVDDAPVDIGKARLWLALFAISITCVVTSKWYGVMIYPATLGIIAFVWAQRPISRFAKEYYEQKRRPARWGNPFGFPLDVVLSTLVFVAGTIYFAAYTPQFIGLADTPKSPPRAYSVTDIVKMQYDMYEYHKNLHATHPYASQWWQWPIDARPIAYYWKDSRTGAAANDPKACCVSEITSLPNPVILWFGLFAVPFVGFLAYRERNKGYMLLVVAYLFQWLPWIGSPRIAFAYHFYVNVAVICLCNAIVLQRLFNWGVANPESRTLSRAAVFGYVALAAAAFIFFYPLLAGTPMVWEQWNLRTLPWLMHANWV